MKLPKEIAKFFEFDSCYSFSCQDIEVIMDGKTYSITDMERPISYNGGEITLRIIDGNINNLFNVKNFINKNDGPEFISPIVAIAHMYVYIIREYTKYNRFYINYKEGVKESIVSNSPQTLQFIEFTTNSTEHEASNVEHYSVDLGKDTKSVIYRVLDAILAEKIAPKLLKSSPLMTSPSTKCNDIRIVTQDVGDLSCWANSVINAFMASNRMRQLAVHYFNIYKKDVLDHLSKNDQRKFYDPIFICMNPSHILDKDIRHVMMQMVYKMLCYAKVVQKRILDPREKVNQIFAHGFKRTKTSFSIASLVPNKAFSITGIEALLINIYGKHLFDQHVKIIEFKHLSKNLLTFPETTEIVIVKNVDKEAIPSNKIIESGGIRYELDHISILFKKLSKIVFHYETGILCDNTSFVLDSMRLGTMIECDWINNDYSTFTSDGSISLKDIYIPYALYIKNGAYANEVLSKAMCISTSP